MWGDGHTAYEQGSPDCIDPAIEDYMNTLALPAPGTTCRQDIPFAQPQAAASTVGQGRMRMRRVLRPQSCGPR